MKNDLYEEKDFTDAELADGTTVRVPKAWAGTDLLPAGAKVSKSGRRSSSSSDSGDSGVPSADATREDLEAYAVANGMSEDEAKGYPNKGELHAAIVGGSNS